MPTLFDPINIGDLRLRNRIVMAPLTRIRASGQGRVPNALMRDYYVQRASAGIIITEATSVTPAGVGYPRTPGIWSEEQVDGWRQITDAVHAAGGGIVLQLWHVGRISDPVSMTARCLWRRAPSPRRGTSACCGRNGLTSCRVRSRPTKFRASSRPIAGAPPMPRRPASTVSRFMAPTAICSTSSCRTAPTSAPTAMAARSRIVRASCWK